ncbi:MAG TPA: STAS domain-containing protein [Phycisphaerales bacterium]|nr:STAS domain-containing protein [Phycisphaerales bacterium]
MQIDVERQGAVTILRPRGPLVQKDADALRQKGLDAIGGALGRVVIDAAQVAYLDSSGIEALLDLADELANAGQVLKLCGVNETVREVFEVTETDSQFEHFEDVPAAVRSFL